MNAPDEANLQKLKILYGRLKGIEEFISGKLAVSSTIAMDLNKIIDELGALIGADYSYLKSTQFYHSVNRNMARDDEISPKVLQLIRILEYGYNLNENVMQIGSIYNSIYDSELRERCSDILTAPANFDRVINQATQVLEDRIRTKSGLTRAIGPDLVNRAINPDPSKSVLKINGAKEEHEGMHYICKGIMLAFRNPTHHTLTDKYKRDDALKFCAFVDDLIMIIDESKKTG